MPEHTVPMDGFVTISIDGDRVTEFSVSSGETLSIEMETEE